MTTLMVGSSIRMSSVSGQLNNLVKKDWTSFYIDSMTK